MLNKHFFKSVFRFAVILFVGLAILFVLNEFDTLNDDFKAEAVPRE